MPVLNIVIDYAGRPIVDLYVTIGTIQAEELQGLGEPVQVILPVRALIDTGTGQSHLSLSILEMLRLSPSGEVDLFTASTGDVPELMEEYVVNLAWAGDRPGQLAEDLKVIGSPKLTGLRVDMLLGRDILDGCLLVYDGPNRRFSLAYDSP